MPAWDLHYDRFLIEDCAPERHVGDVFDYFALEFLTSIRLKKYRQKKKTAIATTDHCYQVSAEVVRVSKDGCVIDFGLLAAGRPNQIPSGCKEGDYVVGEVRITLPLCVWPIPEDILKTMRYKWRVNAILADKARGGSLGRNPEAPDEPETAPPYREIVSTEIVDAHTYILNCSKLG